MKAKPSIVRILLLGLPILCYSATSESEILSPQPRGLVVPYQEAQLSSQMDGQVQQIAKKEGEDFEKGEILVTFFCPIRIARLQQAQAALNATKSRLNVNQELVKIRAVSHLDVALIKAEVSQAKAEVAVQQAMVEMCQIQAPFAGRVSNVWVHPFESVAQGKPLLEVASNGSFEVRVIVPSQRYSMLHIGTLFSIQLEETGRSYPVRIIRLGGRIDPVSQTLPILGQIIGTFPELIPGMGGQVTFSAPTP